MSTHAGRSSLALLVFILIGSRHADAPAADRVERGCVKAEVRGRLVWRDSRYRVVARLQEHPPKELVLDLWISEDKVLVSRLAGLRNRQVVVAGEIIWVPKDARVASDDDYTLGFQRFEISEVAGSTTSPSR